MPKLLTVRHTTTYEYVRPVALGRHRMMMRPRDSHDLRVIDAVLTLSPAGRIGWSHDVFGNSIAHVDFDFPASRLLVESVLELERYALERPRFQIERDAGSYPFIYHPDDGIDLGRLREAHHPDPDGRLDRWARSFVTGRPMDTVTLLVDLNEHIHSQFDYVPRHALGTQTPLDTLELGSGTCRDFAALMMETVRTLGFGARFVTGYLYDPALDPGGNGEDGVLGAGATHAWIEVYLPGAGWVEFDPTNGLIGSEALIRVAVTREPAQASPVSGTFTGLPGDFLGMTVDVSVTAREEGEPVRPAEPPAAPRRERVA